MPSFAELHPIFNQVHTKTQQSAGLFLQARELAIDAIATLNSVNTGGDLLGEPIGEFEKAVEGLGKLAGQLATIPDKINPYLTNNGLPPFNPIDASYEDYVVAEKPEVSEKPEEAETSQGQEASGEAKATSRQYDLSFTEDIPPVDPNSWLGKGGDSRWGVNDSSFEKYAADAQFPDYYPGGLKGIIEEALSVNDTNVGLDIAGGSQARALRDLIESGTLTKGLVTNLEDLRAPEIKADTRVDHVAGDLALRKNWENIIRWQTTHAPEGLSLIMHKPFAGLQDLTPNAYEGAAHTLIDMLRPGGVFFTQVPSSLHAHPQALLATYRRLLKRPDVSEIIPSTRASFEAGKHAFAVIIKR